MRYYIISRSYSVKETMLLPIWKNLLFLFEISLFVWENLKEVYLLFYILNWTKSCVFYILLSSTYQQKHFKIKQMLWKKDQNLKFLWIQ